MNAEEKDKIRKWLINNHPDPDSLFTGDFAIDEKIQNIWFPTLEAYHKAKANKSKEVKLTATELEQLIQERFEQKVNSITDEEIEKQFSFSLEAFPSELQGNYQEEINLQIEAAKWIKEQLLNK